MTLTCFWDTKTFWKKKKTKLSFSSVLSLRTFPRLVFYPVIFSRARARARTHTHTHTHMTRLLALRSSSFSDTTAAVLTKPVPPVEAAGLGLVQALFHCPWTEGQRWWTCLCSGQWLGRAKWSGCKCGLARLDMSTGASLGQKGPERYRSHPCYSVPGFSPTGSNDPSRAARA